MLITPENRNLIRKPQWMVDICCALLILLLVYTALYKLAERNLFAYTIEQSALLRGYSEPLSWTVPITELVVAALLFNRSTRKLGLQLSIVLLLLFTIYIGLMLAYGGKLPCSCGGVVNSLSWKEHIVFNLLFIVIGFCGLYGIKRLQWHLSHNPP